jgi:tetratricopeptide (TPR) repeat protein
MGSELKRKSSMLLHQIEEALGTFVLNNGDIESLNLEAVENIHRREIDKGRSFSRSSIKDVVEATYLDELFGFALDITRDSSVSDSVNYLYSMFHYLDIYEIRNAISHPNRPFWDCYWYRIATIASDPVNEILGLDGIKEALISAESGVINDPPEEWINKVIWQIPNNLPNQFDHELTGLIGRSKELQDLKKYISNPRVNTIALVAPGGAGKTALALDLLNSIISTPNYTKHVDAVLYVTMKTEKLTSDGVVSLDAIETIVELKQSICESINEIFSEEYDSFDEAIKKHENEKLLICIDNLETLLRDSQINFENLNHELPPVWQVLVTSRISISNSTILSLDALKEKSAIHLARTYLSKRGGPPLENKMYEKLTKECFYNPLAIRLTIDLIVSGNDLPKSLNVANKEIAEFSYNNLITTLSVDSIEILEAIFVEGLSTRLSLCELLGKDLDDISTAVGELSKTSLITRNASEQGESYSLSDSVRELLLISPRNIQVRNSVQNNIHKRRVISKEIDIRQKEKRLPNWHSDFIPNETSENLKILVTNTYKNLTKGKRNINIAIENFKRLKESKLIYDNESLYHKAFARILEVLKDYKSAEDHYIKAYDLDDTDPSTTYLLARLYHDTKRYEKAHQAYKSLIDKGWTSNDSEIVPFGMTIYNGYFLSLLYQAEYEKVLEETKKWKEAQAYRGILGTYRASAWKRKMENVVDDDPEKAVDALIRSSRILSDVFRSEGYFITANKQAVKLFEEIEFCYSRPEYCKKYAKQGLELLKFISQNIVQINQSKGTEIQGQLIKKLSRIQIEKNPFKESNWSSLTSIEMYLDESIYSPKGLLTVKISNRPKDKASFLFAKDGFDKDYFLHFDNLKDGNWKDWCQLSVGTTLDIVSGEENNSSDKAVNACEIYIHT